MKQCLAGCQYIPSIEYFAHWIQYGTVLIEAHENFQKRTWRNKTAIIGNDAELLLSIPLKKGKHDQQPIQQVKISYDEQWFRMHFNSIKTAYGKSAYFFELEADLRQVFYSGYEKLWDLNLELLKYFSGIISSSLKINFTTTYLPDYGIDVLDLRSGIPAARSRLAYEKIPTYHQVQRINQSFLPNLSILDLVCHLGPEAYGYLHLYSKKLYEKHAERN